MNFAKRLATVITLAALCACSGGGSPLGAAAPLGAVASLDSFSARGFAADPSGSPRGKIQHVVIILQENRSTDNLFHGLPGADTANSGLDSNGNVVQLKQEPLVEIYDFAHTHKAFLNAYDNGKMDGANLNKAQCGISPECKALPPDLNYAYVQRSDIAEYFTLAEEYAFGDRMFQTNQGQSYPAHQFIIAGTSEPSVGSDLFVSENPFLGGINVGCKAPKSSRVLEIEPNGKEDLTTYPCFEHATLMDLLDAKHRTWKYYTNASDSVWNGPNSIKHIRFGAGWKNVVVPESRVLRDIASGHLADVAWVNPNSDESDHPGVTNGTGPAWVASIVNAIGKSGYWKNTAIFVSWDDWGGLYDHVAPTIYDSYEYGLRVPLVVVSPYAKRGYVSHVTHDFGSILKFTEETFGLPSLGFADARADDLSDCFNFGGPARTFQAIPSRHDAQYFLSQPEPAGPADSD